MTSILSIKVNQMIVDIQTCSYATTWEKVKEKMCFAYIGHKAWFVCLWEIWHWLLVGVILKSINLNHRLNTYINYVGFTSHTHYGTNAIVSCQKWGFWDKSNKTKDTWGTEGGCDICMVWHHVLCTLRLCDFRWLPFKAVVQYDSKGLACSDQLSMISK